MCSLDNVVEVAESQKSFCQVLTVALMFLGLLGLQRHNNWYKCVFLKFTSKLGMWLPAEVFLQCQTDTTQDESQQALNLLLKTESGKLFVEYICISNLHLEGWNWLESWWEWINWFTVGWQLPVSHFLWNICGWCHHKIWLLACKLVC